MEIEKKNMENLQTESRQWTKGDQKTSFELLDQVN